MEFWFGVFGVNGKVKSKSLCYKYEIPSFSFLTRLDWTGGKA